MAVHNLAAYISEAKGNKFSMISSLGEQDVVTIWRTTSQYIKKQMLQLKGVAIPDFGCFTFCQIKLPVGKNKFYIIQRPVFVFSEWFLQTHSLTCTKPCASGHIPVTPLNYTALSNEGSYSRDSFQLCVKEILLAMSRCLFAKKNVHLDFCDVGRLTVKDSRIQMRFFRNFIRQLDFNGDLESVFRPRTAQSEVSIMTNPSPCQHILPKLYSRELSNTHLCTVVDGDTMDVGSKAKEKKLIVPSQDEGLDSQKLLPRKTALLVSIKEPDGEPQEVATSMSRKKSPQSSRINGESKDEKLATSTDPVCSHDTVPGQELCYFCHQRSKRNAYIDISDEKKAKELQYAKIMHDYQEKKRTLASAREREAKKIAELFAKDAALHNFSRGQSKKARRDSGTFHPSCIFQYHAVPDSRLKQREYCSQLDSQLKKDQQALREIRNRKEKMEREEQNELKQRLQRLEETFTKEKAEKIAKYKKALVEQIGTKSCTPTHDQVDSSKKLYPLFGVCDDPVESLRNKQASNKAILTAHLQEIKERREKDEEEATRTKLEDADMMKKAKQELIHEYRTTNRDKVLERRLLERSWDVTSREKYQQQLHDARLSKDLGLLLQEQCEKYKRCNQCQRHRGNRGESYFHPERQFYSGSKLVIL